MSDLAIFSYVGQDVRTAIVAGENVYVGKDVCDALGIAKYRDAIAQLDADERVSIIVDTLGGRQQMTAVTEAGIYNLALISRPTKVKPFMRWLTHVVLPELRQKGSYSIQPAETPEQLLARALVMANETLTAKTAELEAALPRAEAWDAIASAHGDYSVGDSAKILSRHDGIEIGPQRLFRKLGELKWTYRDADRHPRAYAHRVDRGYLAEKASFHYHPGTGERVVDAPQVRVTVKGIERLRQIFGGRALPEVSELAAVSS